MIKKLFSVLLVSLLLLAGFAAAASAAMPNELRAQLLSETAILIDGRTGQVLFEKDMHRQMYPASTTKVTTAILALENGNLNSAITMSRDAVFSIGRDTSHVALDTDEVLTLENALYALSLASANDAANGIAEHIGETMDDFAAMMTRRAEEAGALNTSFANAHGLHDVNHYTTAYDLAHIMMEALKLPKFREIFSTLTYEMPPTNKQNEVRTFRRPGSLLAGQYVYEGIIAEKTGWTEHAGNTLVTAAERNGRTLIAVVMKSPSSNDKWKDATALLDFGFDEFQEVRFTPEELGQDNHPVAGLDSGAMMVNLSAADGFQCLLPYAFSKDDIEIAYEAEIGKDNTVQAKTVFSLRDNASSLWFADLGELALTGKIVSAHPPGPEPKGGRKGGSSPLPWILGIVLLLLAFPIVLLTQHYIVHRQNSKRRVVSYAMLPEKKYFWKKR